MPAPSLPTGFSVQLQADSWVPILDAPVPALQQPEEHSKNKEAYPECTQPWGETGGGEYWMGTAYWYDIASNLTGPDRQQGALLGLYVDAWLLSDTQDLDAWSVGPMPIVRGQAIGADSIQTDDFSNDGRRIREPCARVRMWVGPPQLPVYHRPAETDIQIKGDWVLGGFTASKFLVMNATAVFQDNSAADKDVSVTPPSSSKSHLTVSASESQSSTLSTTTPTETVSRSPTPSTSRTNPKIIIAAVLTTIALIFVIVFVVWLVRCHRDRRGRSSDNKSDTTNLRAFTLMTNDTSNMGSQANQKAALPDEKRFTPYRYSATRDAVDSLAHRSNRPETTDLRASSDFLQSSSSTPSTSLPNRPMGLRRDYEDDETMLRELRAAMRVAGITVNMLFTRLNARAESVVGTEAGLPPYDTLLSASRGRGINGQRQGRSLTSRRGLGRR